MQMNGIEREGYFRAGLHLALLLVLAGMPPVTRGDEGYVQWKNENFAIEDPLTDEAGDVQRGRTLVIATDKGNCLACHKMPIPEEPFHGTLGPDLGNIANRLNEAQIRLRVVDEKQINPHTVMPGYYRDPEKLRLVANEYTGQTLLTAQEVEDVVAYLMTLKE